MELSYQKFFGCAGGTWENQACASLFSQCKALYLCSPVSLADGTNSLSFVREHLPHLKSLRFTSGPAASLMLPSATCQRQRPSHICWSSMRRKISFTYSPSGFELLHIYVLWKLSGDREYDSCRTDTVILRHVIML